MKKLLLVFTALIGLCLIILLDVHNISVWRHSKQIELGTEADLIRSRLESALNTRIITTNSLKALVRVKNNISEDDFKKIAQNLMEYNSSIRALQIADKDTRVILVYPPKQ